MYLCYIDESGTPDLPGNTSHFVLAGLAIPIWFWKNSEQQIQKVKTKYNLDQAEIHTHWLLRKYLEQSKIKKFEKLSYADRRSEVERHRKSELLKLQKSSNSKAYKQIKKNYSQTNAYIHLTYDERVAFVSEIATTISDWQYARLFAECIDKIHFDPSKSSQKVDEQAFEQVVSRFEQFLTSTNITKFDETTSSKNFGLIIHDNNPTVAKKHTELMKSFHRKGTFWTKVDHIIETPLFVDSDLTGMIQIADVCAYSIRRYLENNESSLFDKIYCRADKKNGKVVGTRHFTSKSCKCEICSNHKRAKVSC